jgi:hypothetical protein
MTETEPCWIVRKRRKQNVKCVLFDVRGDCQCQELLVANTAAGAHIRRSSALSSPANARTAQATDDTRMTHGYRHEFTVARLSSRIFRHERPPFKSPCKTNQQNIHGNNILYTCLLPQQNI